MIQILFPSTGLQDEVVDITEKKKSFIGKSKQELYNWLTIDMSAKVNFADIVIL